MQEPRSRGRTCPAGISAVEWLRTSQRQLWEVRDRRGHGSGRLAGLCCARGQRLDGHESLIFILAISRVLQSPSNVWNVLGYSSGFAVGTWVGLKIEERLALGYAAMQVITQTAGDEVSDALRQAGHGVTELLGEGLHGKVYVINTVVNRRDIPSVMELVSAVDETAFVTVDDASRVYRGYLQRRGKA
jgi:uncharacterized protein YebE (UPF0316 family)